MQIKCINRGVFINLTVDRVYTVIEESRDYYKVTNNAGIDTRYGKNYFEVVPEETTEAAAETPRTPGTMRARRANGTFAPANPAQNTTPAPPIPTPPPPPPSRFSASRDRNNLVLRFGTRTERLEFSIAEIANNCGTGAVYSINSLCSVLRRMECFTAENLIVCIRLLIEMTGKCIVVFTTNNEYPLLWTVLDTEADFQSASIVNPNSDNPIKLWGFYNIIGEDGDDEDDDDF